MADNLPPQRRYHVLDQHSTFVRILHAPGLSEADAIIEAKRVFAGSGVRSVRVVEFGCDPTTGADGPNFNLGPAPGGGYIVSRLVYDSASDVDEDAPFYTFLRAVREAVEDYDLTKDHDPRHNGITKHDCVRCHIVACLPPGEQPERDRKRAR